MPAEKWESLITASVPCSSANRPPAISVPDRPLPEDYCASPPAPALSCTVSTLAPQISARKLIKKWKTRTKCDNRH